MLVNSMNPVLVLIKWKARIDFWKSQMETWHRLSRRYQHAGESWIAHDNGNKSAFKDFFFCLQFSFIKFINFWHFSHSKNVKSKETYALTTPHRIWFNDLQLWGSAGRQSLWTIREQLEKSLPQDVPLNSAGLTTQTETHHGVGRQHKLLHCASKKGRIEGVVLNNKT